MFTIIIDERTKAGKALLAVAKIMAQHNKGVDIEDDKDLIAKMRKNHNGDILSEEESDNFLLKLRKTSLH